MRSAPSTRGPYLYIAAGVLAGVAYALLNTQTDDWARAGSLGQTFAAFHAFVDRGIPVLAGGLLGLALHWLHLRETLARAEARSAEELRSRLRHVERDQAVWVVVASALHELKNPLHALGLLVDELEEVAKEGDRAALTDHVRRVRALMDRTLVPLDALRGLTQRGQRTRSIRPIGATVDDVVASLRPVAREAGVELAFAGDRSIETPVDAEYLRIILDNLIANALEARGEGEHARAVVVRVTRDDDADRVTLRVSDDGPGLPEDRRATLFEPLRTSKSEGLGLGLPIARALARTLGGELTAADEPGFSTSFVLTVPAAAT